MRDTLIKFFTPLADLTLAAILIQFAIVKGIIEMYIFRDWQFIAFLVVLIIIDTIMGFMRAWKEKRIESRAWGKVGEKLLLYSCVLVMFHVLINFTVSGTPVGWFKFLENAAYSYIMIREGISIVEHIVIMRPDFFPIWVIERLKKYRDTGRISDLIEK